MNAFTTPVAPTSINSDVVLASKLITVPSDLALFSPALPKLPIIFGRNKDYAFEYEWAPLSFFWLARCMGLSTNSDVREGLKGRITHLSRLYSFPKDLCKHLEAFGERDNSDWVARIPEIKGVRALQYTLNLSEAEYRVVAFIFLCSNSRLLGVLVDFFSKVYSNESQRDIVSKFLGISLNDLKQALSEKSMVVQMRLTKGADRIFSPCFTGFLAMPSSISDRIKACESVEQNILSDLLTSSTKTDLTIDDFDFVGEQLDLIKACVKDASSINGSPFNVLFVGPPGTGKTELARVLAASVDANLYEVPVINKEDPEQVVSYRLAEYVRMNTMLNLSRKEHILFDEVEDVLEISDKKDKQKAWVNNILERRNTTTYWVCNSADKFDAAFLRRFDYVLHMPRLDYRSRIKMMNDAFLPLGAKPQYLKSIAAQAASTPALIKRIKNLVARVQRTSMSVESALKIYFASVPAWYSEELGEFSIKHCRSSGFLSVVDLAKHCQKNSDIKVLINGRSGSGKSALSQFLCFDCNESTSLFETTVLCGEDPDYFFSIIEDYFIKAKSSRGMLVLDDLDHLMTVADRITPSLPLFVKWLVRQMRNFSYPMVATITDQQAIAAFPELEAAFDGQITLKDWKVNAVQPCVDNFTATHAISPALIEDGISTTPNNLIRGLRQCRLSNEMTPMTASLQPKALVGIGFLAKVS